MFSCSIPGLTVPLLRSALLKHFYFRDKLDKFFKEIKTYRNEKPLTPKEKRKENSQNMEDIAEEKINIDTHTRYINTK